ADALCGEPREARATLGRRRRRRREIGSLPLGARAMEKEPPLELDLPDGVDEAAEAVELLRAWIGDGSLLVALNASAFGDHVDDWGRLLAEIGHHIARAAALNGYMREEDAQAAVRDAFVAGFSALGPSASGRLKGRQEH